MDWKKIVDKQIVIVFAIVITTSTILSAVFPGIFGIAVISQLTGINNALTALGLAVGFIVARILKQI